MSTSQSLLPLAMVALLLIAGVGLFLFNIKQAVSGRRQMKDLQRQHKQADATYEGSKALVEELTTLKEQFNKVADLLRLSTEERLRLWKPVDEAVASSVDDYLSGNSKQGNEKVREAIAAARRVLTQVAAA